MKELQDVKDFQRRFELGSHPARPVIMDLSTLSDRSILLQEELDEFKQACHQADLEAQADALVDLVYVALGTVAILGLPWRELWDDVHRANMSKERGMGKRGIANDVVKPAGWVGPKTRQILADAANPPVWP